ncbi:hypothetical protein LJR034_001461 [Caballeronia sp. LjRoot34]|uniref:hypothetical protein n=1 Tax=Caballeronia sp. LjRoot34 TaxID=3342325 RepID=UPI003ED09B1B
MIDQQLESVEIGEEEAINITPDDQSWDLVKLLRKSRPGLRNELAHEALSDIIGLASAFPVGTRVPTCRENGS